MDQFDVQTPETKLSVALASPNTFSMHDYSIYMFVEHLININIELKTKYDRDINVKANLLG